jgi:hypothetical protein
MWCQNDGMPELCIGSKLKSSLITYFLDTVYIFLKGSRKIMKIRIPECGGGLMTITPQFPTNSWFYGFSGI